MIRIFLVLGIMAISASADLNFNEAIGVLEQIKGAIVPLIVAVCSLSAIIAGYLYITGKGNVGKEVLINIIIGSIIVGVAVPLSTMLINK